MALAQDYQHHRAAARGVQAADQDADAPAVRRDRGHVVLGAARLGPDHHAQGRRLAEPREAAGSAGPRRRTRSAHASEEPHRRIPTTPATRPGSGSADFPARARQGQPDQHDRASDPLHHAAAKPGPPVPHTDRADRSSLARATQGSCRTITFDRGTEFAAYDLLAQASGTEAYFCDPHSPWQKGAVENTNGRIRRFLPGDPDLAELVNDESSDDLMLNATPRRCLGYRTPNEAFQDQLAALPRPLRCQTTQSHFASNSSSSPSRYFQSMRARIASAARRSGRFSRNCRIVTSARTLVHRRIHKNAWEAEGVSRVYLGQSQQEAGWFTEPGIPQIASVFNLDGAPQSDVRQSEGPPAVWVRLA